MNDEPLLTEDGLVHRSSFIVHRLVSALWFGAGACLLFIAAPAAFKAAGSPAAAANVVGAMLTRWHYVSLAVPVLLLILGWRSARGLVTSILFAAILFAAAQAIVDTRIRAIRQESLVPISELSRSDPLRRRFGLLHGVSSMLLLAQVLSAGVIVGLRDRN